jgi:hypothetical protein
MICRNNASGGIQGVTISNANSGGASGVAWDGTTIGGSGADAQYDSLHVYKSKFSYKFVSPSALNQARMLSWGGTTGGALGAVLTEIWTRQYWYFTAYPASTRYFTINTFWTWGGSLNCFYTLEPTGFISATDIVSSHSTGTKQVPLNQFIRLETHITTDPTNGHMDFWWYAAPGSSYATDTASVTNFNTGSTFSHFQLGPDGADTDGTIATTAWCSIPMVSTLGKIGPEPPSFEGMVDSDMSVSIGT